MVSIEERRELRRRKILESADLRIKKIIYSDTDGKLTANTLTTQSPTKLYERQSQKDECISAPSVKLYASRFACSIKNVERYRHISALLIGAVCRLLLELGFQRVFPLLLLVHASFCTVCHILSYKVEPISGILVGLLSFSINSERLARRMLQIIDVSKKLTEDFITILASFFIVHVVTKLTS